MASFYFPKTITFDSKNVIIYPCIGIEKVIDREEKNSIEDYVQQVLTENEKLTDYIDTKYFLTILWENDGKKMCDVWMFGKPENWHSGPLVDVRIFQDTLRVENIGVSAGDGLVLLGIEETHRRSVENIDIYFSQRPQLPKNIEPTEEFYTI